MLSEGLYLILIVGAPTLVVALVALLHKRGVGSREAADQLREARETSARLSHLDATVVNALDQLADPETPIYDPRLTHQLIEEEQKWVEEERIDWRYELLLQPPRHVARLLALRDRMQQVKGIGRPFSRLINPLVDWWDPKAALIDVIVSLRQPVNVLVTGYGEGHGHGQ